MVGVGGKAYLIKDSGKSHAMRHSTGTGSGMGVGVSVGAGVGNGGGGEGSDEAMSEENMVAYVTECPLCAEALDVGDYGFFPCPCDYQVCLWCLERIRTQENNKCPQCRRDYDEREYRRIHFKYRHNDNEKGKAAGGRIGSAGAGMALGHHTSDQLNGSRGDGYRDGFRDGFRDGYRDTHRDWADDVGGPSSFHSDFDKDGGPSLSRTGSQQPGGSSYRHDTALAHHDSAKGGAHRVVTICRLLSCPPVWMNAQTLTQYEFLGKYGRLLSVQILVVRGFEVVFALYGSDEAANLLTADVLKLAAKAAKQNKDAFFAFGDTTAPAEPAATATPLASNAAVAAATARGATIVQAKMLKRLKVLIGSAGHCGQPLRGMKCSNDNCTFLHFTTPSSPKHFWRLTPDKQMLRQALGHQTDAWLSSHILDLSAPSLFGQPFRHLLPLYPKLRSALEGPSSTYGSYLTVSELLDLEKEEAAQARKATAAAPASSMVTATNGLTARLTASMSSTATASKTNTSAFSTRISSSTTAPPPPALSSVPNLPGSGSAFSPGLERGEACEKVLEREGEKEAARLRLHLSTSGSVPAPGSIAGSVSGSGLGSQEGADDSSRKSWTQTPQIPSAFDHTKPGLHAQTLHPALTGSAVSPDCRGDDSGLPGVSDLHTHAHTETWAPTPKDSSRAGAVAENLDSLFPTLHRAATRRLAPEFGGSLFDSRTSANAFPPLGSPALATPGSSSAVAAAKTSDDSKFPDLSTSLRSVREREREKEKERERERGREKEKERGKGIDKDEDKGRTVEERRRGPGSGLERTVGKGLIHTGNRTFRIDRDTELLLVPCPPEGEANQKSTTAENVPSTNPLPSEPMGAKDTGSRDRFELPPLSSSSSSLRLPCGKERESQADESDRGRKASDPKPAVATSSAPSSAVSLGVSPLADATSSPVTSPPSSSPTGFGSGIGMRVFAPPTALMASVSQDGYAGGWGRGSFNTEESDYEGYDDDDESAGYGGPLSHQDLRDETHRDVIRKEETGGDETERDATERGETSRLESCERDTLDNDFNDNRQGEAGAQSSLPPQDEGNDAHDVASGDGRDRTRETEDRRGAEPGPASAFSSSITVRRILGLLGWSKPDESTASTDHGVPSAFNLLAGEADPHEGAHGSVHGPAHRSGHERIQETKEYTRKQLDPSHDSHFGSEGRRGFEEEGGGERAADSNVLHSTTCALGAFGQMSAMRQAEGGDKHWQSSFITTQDFDLFYPASSNKFNSNISNVSSNNSNNSNNSLLSHGNAITTVAPASSANEQFSRPIEPFCQSAAKPTLTLFPCAPTRQQAGLQSTGRLPSGQRGKTYFSPDYLNSLLKPSNESTVKNQAGSPLPRPEDTVTEKCDHGEVSAEDARESTQWVYQNRYLAPFHARSEGIKHIGARPVSTRRTSNTNRTASVSHGGALRNEPKYELKGGSMNGGGVNEAGLNGGGASFRDFGSESSFGANGGLVGFSSPGRGEVPTPSAASGLARAHEKEIEPETATMTSHSSSYKNRLKTNACAQVGAAEAEPPGLTLNLLRSVIPNAKISFS